MTGTYGYELDTTQLSSSEKDLLLTQANKYKKYYNIITYGNYYRLTNPYNKNNYEAWQFVSENKKESLITIIIMNTPKNAPQEYVRLKGLICNKEYYDESSTEIYIGAALMNMGLPINLGLPEYTAIQIHLLCRN